MADRLRILLAEDSPTDAELINYALRKAGLVYEAIRVETKEKFVEAIREFKPDIIISDYEMPDFKGSTALAIALVECPDVPFILVSGAVSETLADEMLKAGAVDYIPKQNLSRLAPAARRVIDRIRERKSRGVTEASIGQSPSRMEKTLLLAEDSPTDAELINYALRKSGLKYEAIRVQTKEKFVEGIREFKPDIIISDYEMPDFKGSSALAISLAECPDVPFILVSGAVSEAIADQMIHAGAVDFISKQNLSLLAPAVRRATAKRRERKSRCVTGASIGQSPSRMEKTHNRAVESFHRLSLSEGTT